jgi:hypothetical protein
MEFKKSLDILDKLVNKIINNIDNGSNERKYILPTIVQTDTIKCKDCDLDTYVENVKPIYNKSRVIYPAIIDTEPDRCTVKSAYNTYDKVCDMV